MSRKKLIYTLAAECDVDWKTVDAWLTGKNVRPVVENALRAAVEKLSLTYDVAKHRTAAA